MTGLATRPRKVLVIGSGPIVIGQAAEFDYAGTQACKALREEGVTTILVNSNPATIMTDNDIADRVYIEPLTVDVIERVIIRERPDGLLPTLGGQTGLNLAVSLSDSIFYAHFRRAHSDGQPGWSVTAGRPDIEIGRRTFSILPHITAIRAPLGLLAPPGLLRFAQQSNGGA